MGEQLKMKGNDDERKEFLIIEDGKEEKYYNDNDNHMKNRLFHPCVVGMMDDECNDIICKAARVCGIESTVTSTSISLIFKIKKV